MDYLAEHEQAADWLVSTPEAQGVDSAQLVQMGEYMDASGEDFHSVLIARHGRLVLEAYYHPYQQGTKHMLASATKSFTATLIGAAIDRGYISGVDAKVLYFFPEYEFAEVDERKRAMTIRHLLGMASGLDWTQSWARDNPEAQMFQTSDPVQFILDRPMAAAPGTTFQYSGGASHLLSVIVQRTTGRRAFEFAREVLFEPLGFTNGLWESRGPSGATLGCAGLYLRPRDMAKLGQLYLQGGEWQGQRLVAPEWVEESFAPCAAANYGYQWWRLAEWEGAKAWGYGGQHIAVFPEQDMVVVFTGGIKDSSVYPLHLKLYRDFIIPAVQGDAALPDNPQAQGQLADWVERVGRKPVPTSIGELPALAQRISGRKYVLESNSFGFEWFALEFEEGKPEATFQCALRWEFEGEFPLGLDGLFRYEKVAAYKTSLAFKGKWENERTFHIDLLNVDFGYRYGFTLRFKDERVEICATSVIENMEEQIVGRVT